MDNDDRSYMAIWTHNLAYALDVYPDEIERVRKDLSCRTVGVSGPYDTAEEATTVAKFRMQASAGSKGIYS